jgi:hypothetical protein
MRFKHHITNIGVFLLFALSITLAPPLALPAKAQAPTKQESNQLRTTLDSNVDLKSAAAQKVDVTTAEMFSTTLTAATTFTFNGKRSAGRHFYLRLRQDATGSRLVTWPTTVRWSGGTAPTLTTTASKTDVFEFIDTGTYFLGRTYALNFTES